MDNNFENIWNKYRHQLLNFVKKRIDDINLAEDIVQDVFLKAKLKIHTLNDSGKIRSWLFQITRNCITDYYRNKKPQINLDDKLKIENEAQENDVYNRLQLNVLGMLQKLPPKYKQALFLADYKGLTHKEVSQIIGISYTGAKTRIQRGRKMMREIYLDCCHFEYDSYGNIIDYYPH